MSKINFPQVHTLENLQEYIRLKCIERGFDKASDLETFLLFSEEVGEMAKAIRKSRHLFDESTTTNEKKHDLAEEMADVLSYLLDLANHFNIDLAQALQEKEAENDKRTWN